MISSPRVATFTGITFIPSHLLSPSELGLIRALTAAQQSSTNCRSSVCFNERSRMVFDGTPLTLKPSQIITVAPLQRPYGQHHVVDIWKAALSLTCLPPERPVCQAGAVHLQTSLRSACVQITGSSLWSSTRAPHYLTL